MKPPKILLVLLMITLFVLLVRMAEAQSYQRPKYKYAPSVNKPKVKHEWIIWNRRVLELKGIVRRKHCNLL